MHVISPRARLQRLLAVAIYGAVAVAPVAGIAAEPDAASRGADAAAPSPAPTPPSSPAEGPEAAKAACHANYEEAQVARRQRRLLDARTALRVCSGAACPSAIRADCVDWLDQVGHSLPSVVVTARARGADVLDVKVFVDDKLATEKLSGFALELDPGLHKFRFESPPWPVIEREVLANEGVKDRPIEVDFAPSLTPPAANLAATREPPGPLRLERSDYLFGGIALAGFATLVYFGGTGLYDAHNLQTSCGSYCDHQDVNDVRTKLVIADIGLAVGMVALALGLYLHGKGAF
jgi:hypothetical protein